MLDRLTIERMLRFAGGKPVLVALSGGGDSVALLHLLAGELGAQGVRSAIVDHALREGSAADAARARSFADALGVCADVLTLNWPKGPNRAQQAAREARYRALCAHARAHGLNVIATAHNNDDQAETVLMRAASGSTWRGLAGIAPFAFAPLWPEGRGVAVARPLLGARRTALRDFLRGRSAEWIEDPANANPAFERVRVRAKLADWEAGGLDPVRLARVAQNLRARAETLDRAALGLIERAARPGYTTYVVHAEWTAPREVRRRALAVLMAAAAGASREPSATEMEELEHRVMRRDHRGCTHSGVDFNAAQGGVYLARELGAVLGRADGAPPLAQLELAAGVETIWDGRLAVTAPEPGWRVVPARNAELVGFEKAGRTWQYQEVREALQLRPMALERIRHAFAPDINLAKP